MAKTKHHLFLDANIYLRFFKLSNADVKELGQLTTLVKSGEVRLYLTEQVRDEFNRNRDEAIAESLAGIREKELKGGFPRMLRDHGEFPALREAAAAYEAQRQKMVTEITNEAKNRKLAADLLIAELFDLAEFIPLSDELWETARRRYDLRNPPGKGKSYGDAVHWVSLLHAVPDGEDILIVSADGDFQSKLDSTEVSDFLRDEWAERKAGTARLYQTLPDLFREQYPDMHLLEEMEQEMTRRAIAVRSLAESVNFLQTHAAIQDLSKFADFLPQEVEDLFAAAMANSQIRWILQDPDVSEFYSRLAREYSGSVDWRLIDSVRHEMGPSGWLEEAGE